jgi:hypothetical protein
MKKIFIDPLFFLLLASLFSGCICKHCDPREYNVDYYLQNSMDEPVMFGVCKQDTIGNLIYFVIDTIQPNEKILGGKRETVGQFPFLNDTDIQWSLFCPKWNYEDYNRYFFMFGDSSRITYTVYGDVGNRKTPQLADYWTIVKTPQKNSKGEYKLGNYTLQYNIDEEDYRNALEQNGSN